MLPRIQVDLGAPPSERWRGLSAYVEPARALTDSYVRDLGGMDVFGPMVDVYRAAFVSEAHGQEIDAIAAIVGRSPAEVLVANLYYDAMRAVLGCTAFAVDTPTGPLHARNLDWWTEQRMLSDYTLVAECAGGASAGPFQLVGWPGFMGAFSGVAEGRFAVTLNAVISAETPQLAPSITLLLRSVLETAPDYEAAVLTLAETPIAADCLLLVSGVEPGQMAVVERTSTRGEIRVPEDGLVVVTNDYRVIDGGFAPADGNALQATACARFDRATALALQGPPTDAEACFAILEDPRVKMDITVQHMVMQASTGRLEVRLPRSTPPRGAPLAG